MGSEATTDTGQLAEVGCGESFTAATKVLLASGAAIPISQLKMGDKVLATNVRTGKTSPETVTAVMVKRDTNRYDLTVRTSRGSAVIQTTSSHPFWDQAARRWVKAGALKYGDHLRSPSGAAVTVVGGYVPADATGWMWDLSVPGGNDHDFYIVTTTADVLVHNCSSSQGVYSFDDQWNPGETYVGESMNLRARLAYWVRVGRLSSVENR